jgi:NADH-quinone oxidoreductase subunit G
MPTIKIDDREIPFEPGDTIIKAAHRAGIDIPHYCWHPGLSVAANCRMCLVEVLPGPNQRAMRLDVLRWDAESGKYVKDQKPKLQPACQMGCADGMQIRSDSSNHVSDARKAVQELLLLNHPVDCPICDQAGECRLQDYWLEHGRYKKRMHDEIVHKPKGVSFGPTIVYDAERCIVCTRCVRFVEEVAKDPVLEKRERGNLGEIFVSPGKQLNNNYTLMTEHVCPVGALTSKDFRFKARVWFLRSVRSICQGCATGCNAHMDFDPRNQTVYRYRPRDNEEVNQYWMCDVGMLSYARVNEKRVTDVRSGGATVKAAEALKNAAKTFKGVSSEKIAIVLSAQHSSEDNFALAHLAKKYLGVGDFYLTGKAKGEADGVLMVEDKNPNTAGATEVASTTPPEPFSALLTGIEKGRFTHVIALGADVPVAEKEAISGLKRLKALIAISPFDGALTSGATWVFPASSWAESDGTYVNAKGKAQKSEAAVRPKGDAQPAWLWIVQLAKAMGFSMDFNKLKQVRGAMASEPSVSTAPMQEQAEV